MPVVIRSAQAGSRWNLHRTSQWQLAFHSGEREDIDMAGGNIRRVAAISTGTIGASWTALFLARGLTVAASDPAPGSETFLREFVAAAWPSLARLSPLPAEPPWAALSFHTEPKAALAGAEFVQESAPEREDLKRAFLARRDAVLDPEIVIASSSSGLLMSRIQIDCRHPERCVIGHPFQSWILTRGERTNPSLSSEASAPTRCRQRRSLVRPARSRRFADSSLEETVSSEPVSVGQFSGSNRRELPPAREFFGRYKKGWPGPIPRNLGRFCGARPRARFG
jgi:hypothetical protein